MHSFATIVVVFSIAFSAEGNLRNVAAEAETYPGLKYLGSMDSFDKNGNSVKVEYHISTIFDTWTNGSTHCLTINNGKLVSLETEEEDFLIRELLNAQGYISEYVWTSGMYYAGAWIWSATGRNLEYFNWASIPSTSLSYRITVEGRFSSYKWYTRTITSSHRYICEI